MNFSRPFLAVGLTAALALAMAAGSLAQDISLPIPSVTPSPSPSPTTGPQRGRRARQQQPGGVPTPEPSPSGTPEPPQFTTLDGIWEVELQPVGKRLANYAHFSINSTGANVIGYFQPSGGKNSAKIPMTGTFDGRLISLTANAPNGTSYSFNGYVETFADMVGLLRTSDKDPGTAFTAEHRKKIKN